LYENSQNAFQGVEKSFLEFLMTPLWEELLALEKKLLDPELRRTPEKLAHFLADDFIEFGSSGHAYDKKRVLFLLRKQTPSKLEIEEFRVVEIGPSAALATYRAVSQSARTETARQSLRSSVWAQRDGSWKMIFHQGTPVMEDVIRAGLDFRRQATGPSR
jgi:hypothetical protein